MSTIPSGPSLLPEWWKSATVYQIYPHSFFDSNGDGIGDINGIRAKLDHIKDLGATVIWICPLYCSPLKDMGYDVSDYYNINPVYGTMRDWQKLVEEIHARGMKIVMDAVFNHSSDKHPWFLESKSSKVNPKHDWYIWRPPRYEHNLRFPPNNWASVMQGPAWEWVPERGEYYLHLFTVYQPDLNWDNPAVRNAVVDVLTFWRNKGVDGFRFDAINAISKPPGLPSVRVSDHTRYYQDAHSVWINGPRVHEYLNEVYTKVVAGHDKMTVGETGFTFDPDVIANYVLPHKEQLNQAFNMELMTLDSMTAMPLLTLPVELGEIQDIVEKWQTYGGDKGFWNTIFMENHDFGRSITRFGDDSTPELRALSAKMLATLQVTQTGTLYVYQGQEIGMKNFPKTWGIEEYKDERTQIYWNLIMDARETYAAMHGATMDDILEDLETAARDHARIPMQWDATRNVGFTTGTPWMRAYEEDARAGWNVLDESKDPESILSFWRRAIRIRKEHNILIYGSFTRIETDLETFAYVRKLGNETAWVALNLSPKDTTVSLWHTTDRLGITHGHGVHASVLPQLILSNYHPTASLPRFTGDTIPLRAYEALVFVK